ncbi:ABC transporter permease [Desulfococcus sp.]|uniref:ABC transporter permease n=1 Tax=Desulfococcus sp. TaxID=2025834 RepID=UPI0035940CF7
MGRLMFLLRLFGWFSLRNFRLHRSRTVAVVLGIALGAAVFTSVRLSINASVDAFGRSMDRIAGRADWTVARPGGRVPEAWVAFLLRHPAVDSASPLLQTYVRPASGPGAPFLLIGLDPLLDRPFREWTPERAAKKASGNAPGDTPETSATLDLMTDPATLVMGGRLSDELGVAAGDTLPLVGVRRIQDFRVLGVLGGEGLSRVDGGRIAVTDIATFQEFTGGTGEVDQIDIRLRPGDPTKAAEVLRASLPEGILLSRPNAAKESGLEMIRAYQVNLSVLSFVSLFVGMFLVYSLVALNAASRRREIAILRAVGASRRMVFALFLLEGAFFGMAGWVLAFPASSAMVGLLVEGIGRTISTLFVRVTVDQLNLDAWEVLLSFGVTLAVSILAAVEPAWEAMQVSPREALSAARTRASVQRISRRLFALGVMFAALVWPLSRMPPVSGIPLPGYVATFMLFAGFSLMSPFFLGLISVRLSPLLRRAAGEPAYLAGRYLRDSGVRVAVSVGSLITAVALFTALVIMIHSFRGTVNLWVAQTVSGDLFVTPRLGEINRHRTPFPEEVARAIEAVDTAADRVHFRRFYLTYGRVPYQFEAIDFAPFFRHGGYIWTDGDPDEAGRDLLAGRGVIVSEVFANRTGLGVGGIFRDRIDGNPVEAPILGVIRDYRSQGGVVFFSLDRYEAIRTRGGGRPAPEWSGVRFFFREAGPDRDVKIDRLKAEIAARCGDRIDMIAGPELRRNILRVFDETFSITTVLLLIALLVAALGIATTLTVLVLERSRQLNTIFAVGGSRSQIRRMIVWEASLMVAAGELGGLLCEALLSLLLVFVINRQSFGWTFIYQVDWAALLLSLPLIFATAMLAALPAVRRVFREPPAIVLREG